MNFGLKQGTLVTLASALLLATAAIIPSTYTQAATPRVPSDSLYKQQSYLKQIGMEQAWAIHRDNTQQIIAVVDTGVDLDHPDLRANLVPGYNVLEPGTLPQDNNGHGTNVAGILAAVGNNKLGTAGVLWRAKIMPIKALDGYGRGDELDLAEGIRYAVDHKARIVVLSLGVFNYSTLLKEAILYAERNNVLVVAAAGNEGAEIKYPAAFPTVVSAGGVDPNNKANSKSNRGSELMLVAPWSVYTTALGGGYTTNQGTSMAAPQIAGTAALLWAHQPKLQAHEVRAILAQSATDLGSKGWDATTGFGLVRADKALASKQTRDMFEPNNKQSEAALMPLNRQISANLIDGNSIDWYRINAAYSGELTLDVQTDPAFRSNLRAELYDSKSKKLATLSWSTAKATAKAKISKGTHYIKFTYSKASKSPIAYRLTADFQIADDAYEDNDKQATATNLDAKSQNIKGTFSKVNDMDWYAIRFDNKAEFELSASTDTRRMDLELMVEEEYEYPDIIDGKYEGESEYAPKVSVEAGTTYYIRIRNVNDSDNVNPVAGEYTLNIKITEHLNDWNESNDFSYQAKTIQPKKTVEGTFETVSDQDWFKINITQDSYLNVSLGNLPKGVSYNATLMNSVRTVLQNKPMSIDINKVSYDTMLEPGTYYLKLTTSRPYDAKRYQLRITLDPLTAGYRDIAEHWSKAAVVRLVKADIVQPDDTARFRPDAFISREEAADIVKATLGVNKQGIISVTEKSAGEAISRAQAAEIASKMLKSDGKFGITKPYSDVSYTYWAVRYIREVKDLGIMGAVVEDNFFPEKSMTRAEFATLMVKVLDQK
ncbi:MAG: hypothetical protein RLZZ267_409 [Bacillota bacterium]